jgi:hypothetical protein
MNLVDSASRARDAVAQATHGKDLSFVVLRHYFLLFILNLPSEIATLDSPSVFTAGWAFFETRKHWHRSLAKQITHARQPPPHR